MSRWTLRGFAPTRWLQKRPVLCHTHVTMPAFSHLSSFSTCFKYILFLMFYYFTLKYLDMDSLQSTVWDLLSFLNIQPHFIIINSSTAFLLPPCRTPRDGFKSFHFYLLCFQFYNFTLSLLVALQEFSFSSRIVSVVCCCVRNKPKTRWRKTMNQVSRIDPSGTGWAPLCICRVGLLVSMARCGLIV